MVYGWHDYISKKDENVHHHAKKFVIIIMIIVLAVFFFALNLIVVHPWIDSDFTIDAGGNKSIITLVFKNVGTMDDRLLVLTLRSDGISCDATVPEGCFSSSMETSCNRFGVGEKITYRCFIDSPDTEIRVLMRSRYQTIRDLYKCRERTCVKDESPAYGSSPIFWNYILIYPLDRVINETE